MFFPLKTSLLLYTNNGEMIICQIDHAGESCLTISNVFKRIFFTNSNQVRCSDIPVASKMYINRHDIIGYADINDTTTVDYIQNQHIEAQDVQKKIINFPTKE